MHRTGYRRGSMVNSSRQDTTFFQTTAQSRSIAENRSPVKLRFQTVKSLFDSLVDGGTVPPPRPPLYKFQPRPSGTTETCKETILLPGNEISLHKNRCGRAVHAAATDFLLRSVETFSMLKPQPCQAAVLAYFCFICPSRDPKGRRYRWSVHQDRSPCRCARRGTSPVHRACRRR